MTRSEELLELAQEHEENGADVSVMFEPGTNGEVVYEVNINGESHFNEYTRDEVADLRDNGAYEEGLWNE